MKAHKFHAVLPSLYFRFLNLFFFFAFLIFFAAAGRYSKLLYSILKAGPLRSFQTAYKQVILWLVFFGLVFAVQNESNSINFQEGSGVVNQNCLWLDCEDR